MERVVIDSMVAKVRDEVKGENFQMGGEDVATYQKWWWMIGGGF